MTQFLWQLLLMHIYCKCYIIISRYYFVCFLQKYFNFLNQMHASLWPAWAWFLEIAFVCNVGVCVCVCVCMCVCVSAPEAINYIHVIFNLYNQLNKFVTFRKCNEAILCMGVAIVTKHIVTETNLTRLC